MTPEIIIIGLLGLFALFIACMFGWRLVLPLAIVILGALVLILPNGALLIAGAVAVMLVLGTFYLLGKTGALGGAHITVNRGDGDGNIIINYQK